MTPNAVAGMFRKLQLQGYTLPPIVKTPPDFDEMVAAWVEAFGDYPDSVIPMVLAKFALSRDAAYRGWPTPAVLLDGIRTPIIDDSVAVWDLILAAANSCAGERDRFPSEVDRIAKRRGMKVDVRLVVKCVDETLTLHAVYNTRDDMDRQRVAKSFTPAWLAYKRAWL